MSRRGRYRVISVAVSLIVAVIAITVPLSSIGITPSGMASIGTSVAYAAPGSPVTVYDGIDPAATQSECGRKVFRNPRGLKNYYVFYRDDTDDKIKYAYSSDGSSWTTGQEVTSDIVTATDGVGIAVYDDGSQLHVVHGAVLDAAASYELGYRHGTITDSSSTITWATEQSEGGGDGADSENEVAIIDQGGRVWIAHFPNGELNINAATVTPPPDDFAANRASLKKLSSGTLGGNDDFVTLSAVASDTIHAFWQPSEDTSNIHGSQFTYSAAITQGTGYTLAATWDAGLISAVTTGTTSHLLYKDGSNLKHVTFTSGGFGTPDTVYSGAVDSLSLSIDLTSSPCILYAFYQYGTSGDVYHKTTPVDVISWSSESTIDDDTEDIDYLSASHEDWCADGKIQLVYTTQTNHYIRFLELPPSWESYHDEFAGTADSGTTNSLTDDALTQADDYWNGSWLKITATGDGAPQGESQRVVDFVAATDTMYTADFSAAIDTGDTYVLRTVWGTLGTPYDSDNQTAYMYGESFKASQLYHVGFYDPSEPPNKITSTDPSATVSGILVTELSLNFDPQAESGTWHAVDYEDPDSPPTSYTADDASAVADDDFEVESSAIPEFPTVMAGIAVAGLCFGIYYWMRRKPTYVKA